MEKIKSKTQQKREQKRNQRLLGLLGIIMIALLVAGTAGYALINQQSNNGGGAGGAYEARESNGFEFTRQSNGNQSFWVTQVGQKVIALNYLPEDIEDTKIDITMHLEDFFGKPVYIVNGEQIGDIIAFNLVPEFAQRINTACLANETYTNENAVIKSCNTDIIIQFKEASLSTNQARVYQDRNCIIIEGDKEKGANKLLHYLLGL